MMTRKGREDELKQLRASFDAASAEADAACAACRTADAAWRVDAAAAIANGTPITADTAAEVADGIAYAALRKVDAAWLMLSAVRAAIAIAEAAELRAAQVSDGGGER